MCVGGSGFKRKRIRTGGEGGFQGCKGLARENAALRTGRGSWRRQCNAEKLRPFYYGSGKAYWDRDMSNHVLPNHACPSGGASNGDFTLSPFSTAICWLKYECKHNPMMTAQKCATVVIASDMKP